VGITAGSREVPGRNACDRRHTYCIIIIGKVRQQTLYDQVPKSVKAHHEDKVTILWNQQVQTDRTIPGYKLDITICDKKQGTCMLIDVAIPGDRNVIKK